MSFNFQYVSLNIIAKILYIMYYFYSVIFSFLWIIYNFTYI